ncbi:MAG: DUF5710 domain-containing protein [Rhodoferax sp.]|uniref:DUF5710 domain-containing protein n=1 Tax=Rhodoferax sp. TaxID=50421 RepID=UPI003BB6B651|nr:DUF5710 domain-containing protein [Rhodoferax sp.]
MRINLVTPFAEKDKAKALGARWDAAKKCWYVVDVADLTPFLRWIPNMDAAMAGSDAGIKLPTKDASKNQLNEFKGLTTGPTEVPHCGCDVLPWEDCVHTEKQ